MNGGVKDGRVGGWGTFCGGRGGGVGVCTVQRLVVIKHRVIFTLAGLNYLELCQPSLELVKR